jgi:hypothetical protein
MGGIVVDITGLRERLSPLSHPSFAPPPGWGSSLTAELE